MNFPHHGWGTPAACCVLVLCALWSMASIARAATYRLEEMPAGGANEVTLSWKGAPSWAAAGLEGRLMVPLKLNTAPWRGRQARVYLSVPAQAPGNIGIVWASAQNGPMLPGRLVPGQRSLVYAGVMPATLQDMLDMRFETDGERWSRAHRLQINFEIDVE